jgi:hypothetical protein
MGTGWSEAADDERGWRERYDERVARWRSWFTRLADEVTPDIGA